MNVKDCSILLAICTKTTCRMIVQAALQSHALLDFIGNAMILFGKWIVSANS